MQATAGRRQSRQRHRDRNAAHRVPRRPPAVDATTRSVPDLGNDHSPSVLLKALPPVQPHGKPPVGAVGPGRERHGENGPAPGCQHFPASAGMPRHPAHAWEACGQLGIDNAGMQHRYEAEPSITPHISLRDTRTCVSTKCSDAGQVPAGLAEHHAAHLATQPVEWNVTLRECRLGPLARRGLKITPHISLRDPRKWVSRGAAPPFCSRTAVHRR